MKKEEIRVVSKKNRDVWFEDESVWECSLGLYIPRHYINIPESIKSIFSVAPNENPVTWIWSPFHDDNPFFNYCSGIIIELPNTYDCRKNDIYNSGDLEIIEDYKTQLVNLNPEKPLRLWRSINGDRYEVAIVSTNKNFKFIKDLSWNYLDYSQAIFNEGQSGSLYGEIIETKIFNTWKELKDYAKEEG